MSTVKLRKVQELFPNRKVRTVRTEQLCREMTFTPRVCGTFVLRYYSTVITSSKFRAV